MRLRRRYFLYRGLRKRHQLRPRCNRSKQIAPGAILAFTTLRNERVRLEYFLNYYRQLGVDHFLMVDNASTDGSAEYLAEQPDVSLWTTPKSYKKSRFGVDWLTWLQIRYGHKHWCLTVDADEILVYPHCDSRDLRQLTGWLDQRAIPSFGTIMLDMYPKGALNEQSYHAGQNPFEILRWFDASNFRSQMQPHLQNLWVQGGVRDRVFFSDRPERAPTLNKTPLVKWNRRFAYVMSTHSLLPRRLNHVFGPQATTGALLHSKFLPMISEKSAEEKQRREHFANSSLYDSYYERLTQSPDLWCENSVEYKDWRQLEALGLMSRGLWDGASPKPPGLIFT